MLYLALIFINRRRGGFCRAHGCPCGTNPTKSQNNSCRGCFGETGKDGNGWAAMDPAPPQPHSHEVAGFSLQVKQSSRKWLLATKPSLPWKPQPEGRKAPLSRRVSAPGICIPGFLSLLSLTKETVREGGKTLPPTPFAGRNPCVNMTPSPRERGQWWRLCPPAAARIPAPLPWKPPFCGEQQAL